MKRLHLLLGVSLALTSALAIAQKAPESLLPPGFDEPAPAPAPGPAAAPAAASRPTAATTSAASPAAPSAASAAAPLPGDAPRPGALAAVKLPSLEELEKMSPEEL